MNKQRFVAVFLGVALTFGLLAVAPSLALAANEVVIGVSAPLTGSISTLGQSTKNAALLAQDEVNAKGGLSVGGKKIKARFVIEDDQNEPEATASVFQRLIYQENVLGIIGSQASKCSLAGAPIAESAGVAQLSPWSTNPTLTKGRKWVFRAAFTDDFQGVVVAKFAYMDLKARKAAVLYDVASDYNKGIAEVFRDSFSKLGKVVAFETYTTGDRDFSAQLTRIKQADPDVLFLPNYFNEVPLQAAQAHKLGLKATIIGSDSWDSPKLVELGGDDVNGTYFSNHYSPDIDRPQTKEFVKKYKARFGDVPDAAAALTYDAAYMMFAAVEKAGKLDRKAIRDALAATKGFQGVTGVITFSGGGDPVKSAVMIKVDDGKFSYMKTVNP